MDFKLDIGELTNTINKYENIIKTLEEKKENINKTIAELTEAGWSGEAKDKFMEKHIKNQEFYTNLIEDIKYVKNALENEEKPRAVRLKKQSEDFVNCIKRSEGGAALTNDDTGVISLQYDGQPRINNNVDECIDNYKKMNSKFEEILNLANSLTFTSFPIADDVLDLQNSLKNQTTSLIEFNDSFNSYCNGVKDMEENICSVFSKISGITIGISEFRGVSAISENGQVDKNKVIQLMLKNPKDLTNGEKELLSYVEKVLSKDEYAELKEQVLNQKKNEELVSKIKDLIEGCLKIKKDLINDPVDSFKYLNSSVSKSDFGKVIESSEYYPLVKYLTIRGEAITSGGINFVKAPLELIKSGIEFGGELTNVAKIELDRIFGTNGMDNDETYKKALAKNAQELYYAGDNAYNIIKNIPEGIWEDIKTTGDINKIKDFFLNPNMSLDDAEKWTESTMNLIGITRGGKALSKGKIPVHEKLSTGENLKIQDIKTIGNIETPGNKAENMTQYIRSVLYGQHQFALPNGMGTINAPEDLFEFSKTEGNASNEAKKIIEGVSKATDYGKYSTIIDDKVKVIDKVDLPEWIGESFTDGNYRTVITDQNITFYRTYGGGAKVEGSFVTTTPAGNRINAKINTALVPDWKNSRQYEAVIEVPKGTTINIGRVEKQYTRTGALLEGDVDQILLPQGWPSEWIKEIREVPSR